MAHLGTGVQIAAVGPQNAFLDLNPEVTPFYRRLQRSTRFAAEAHEHLPLQTAGFGKTAVFEVSARGDLLGDMHLQIRVPPVVQQAQPGATWLSPLAYTMMRRVRFVVDDHVIQSHERLWYDLVDRLTVGEGHVAGRAESLGTGLGLHQGHTILLPLQFFRRPRAFFPLALVPNCRVKVEVEIERFAACVAPGVAAQEPATLDVRLVAEHVCLEAEERNSMLLRPLTLMYESVQDMDGLNYVEASDGTPVKTRATAVDLSELNLPVRTLAWVVYAESTPRLFDYLDVVEDATLLYGSLERVAADGPTYSKQQVFSHAPRCQPGANVYAYSFALDPWGEQPSGAVDFSLVQKPVLRVAYKPEAAGAQLKCKVFGVTCNWLTFEKGKVQQVFSE